MILTLFLSIYYYNVRSMTFALSETIRILRFSGRSTLFCFFPLMASKGVLFNCTEVFA